MGAGDSPWLLSWLPWASATAQTASAAHSTRRGARRRQGRAGETRRTRRGRTRLGAPVPRAPSTVRGAAGDGGGAAATGVAGRADVYAPLVNILAVVESVCGAGRGGERVCGRAGAERLARRGFGWQWAGTEGCRAPLFAAVGTPHPLPAHYVSRAHAHVPAPARACRGATPRERPPQSVSADLPRVSDVPRDITCPPSAVGRLAPICLAHVVSPLAHSAAGQPIGQRLKCSH